MSTLFELQQKQVEHDKECHRDIFFLNYQDRFKHMVMHYGKYSGRFANLLKEKHSSDEIQKEIKRTLIDCFIIVLSCADLLQLNLDERMKEKYGLEKSLPVSELVKIVSEGSPELLRTLSAEDEQESVLNLMLEYTSIAGYMLKVGEDLDHMVGFQRDHIRDQTINILVLLLVAASVWRVNFEEEVPKRWEILVQRTVREGPQ